MCAQKQAVSVAEMARLVGLSRARFYQLVGTVFPEPVYDLTTKRPYYTPELQQVCLQVRQTNCGINGKPILFHRKGREVSSLRPDRSRRKADIDRHKDLMDGLKSLGLTATAADVEKALKELHLSDATSKHEGDILKAVFLKLKGQDVSGKKKGDQHETQ